MNNRRTAPGGQMTHMLSTILAKVTNIEKLLAPAIHNLPDSEILDSKGVRLLTKMSDRTLLEFMLEDVEKALKETEMPTMGMMYYNVPDMRIIPRLRERNNDDYLRRLEKAMDGHGIKPHRYLALSEVVYCL